MTSHHGFSADGVSARTVRDTLRRWVLQRLVAPGDFLDEGVIADRLGCARADLRDALLDLAEEGLVVLSPDHGALVASPTGGHELAELEEVSHGLWSLAVRKFVSRASEAQVQALQRAVREFRRIAETDPRPEELVRARDWCYRLLLRVGCCGGVTASLLEDLTPRMGLVLAAGLAEPGRGIRMAVELEAVCAAVAARDEVAAVSAYERHLARSRDCGLRLLAMSA